MPTPSTRSPPASAIGLVKTADVEQHQPQKPKIHNIYVYNIPPGVRWRDVKGILTPFVPESSVLHIQIFDDTSTACVSLNSAQCAETLLEQLDGFFWNGYILTTNPPLSPPPPPMLEQSALFVPQYFHPSPELLSYRPSPHMVAPSLQHVTGPSVSALPPSAHQHPPVQGHPPAPTQAQLQQQRQQEQQQRQQQQQQRQQYQYQQKNQQYQQQRTPLSLSPSEVYPMGPIPQMMGQMPAMIPPMGHPSLAARSPMVGQVGYQMPPGTATVPPVHGLNMPNTSPSTESPMAQGANPPYGYYYMNSYYEPPGPMPLFSPRAMSMYTGAYSDTSTAGSVSGQSTPKASYGGIQHPEQRRTPVSARHLMNLHQYPYHSITDIGTDTVQDPRRLFIGNIPYDTEWMALKDFLRQAGNIGRVEIVKDAHGNSRGFALATYETEEHADRAVNDLNGAVFEGRQITVRCDKYAKKPRAQLTTTPMVQPDDTSNEEDNNEEHHSNDIQSNEPEDASPERKVPVVMDTTTAIKKESNTVKTEQSEPTVYDDKRYENEARRLIESLSLK